MITSERSTIDGWVYETTQMGSKEGRRLLVRLYKLAGPAVAEFLRSLGAEGKKQVTGLGDIGTEAIADVIAELSVMITPDEFDHIVDTLARKTRVSQDGQKWQKLEDVSEMLWAGSHSTTFKFIAFALGANYADFFGGLDNLRSFVSKAAMESQSKSQSSSTGTPTESQPAADTPAA